MSPVTDRHFEKDASFIRETIVLGTPAVAISQADVLFDSFKPGFAFEIESIEHFAEAVTAAASYDVKIGTTTALTAAEVPVAATREDAVLHATEANIRGTATEEINLHCTTDGSGLLTGLKVKVTIRPTGIGYGDG